MTKDEALRLALEALEDLGNHDRICPQWPTYAEPENYPKCNCGYDQAITAIKAALEAKDEPWSPVSIGVDVTKEGTHVIAMRLRPNGVNEVIYSQFYPLAQQEAKDEPVANSSAWFALVMNAAAELEDASHCLRDEDAKQVAIRGAKYYREQAHTLYTTPSQRTWVGLTDEEIWACLPKDPDEMVFARAIEAKLKEKNT